MSKLKENDSDAEKAPIPKVVSNLERSLAKEHRDKIAELLFEKLGNRACEMCDNKGWAVAHALVSPIILESDGDGMVTGAVAPVHMPMVQINCTNCGNSKFFASHALGFGAPPREDKEGADD